MHYKKTILQIIFCFSISLVVGQNGLKVGSEAPLIEFQSSFPPDYKIPQDKPIILDFWATWCGPCIFGLLESNEISSKYADRIDYIAITDKTSSKIESFIKAKKLTQYFIVDNEAKTHERYGVHGIPQAFLIDKNHVIQWTGNVSRLTPEMLDEFLKNGTIKIKSKALPVIETKVSKALPKHELKLSITEKEIPNFENSECTRFKQDTFQYKLNYQPLGDAIVSLYNNQKNRIIYRNLPPEVLNKNISIEFDAINVEVEKTKQFLINCIGNNFQFSAREQNIDTITWEISIADTLKLNQYKTAMTSKYQGFGKGSYEDNRNEEGYFTCLNYTTSKLAEKLEKEYGILCMSTAIQNSGYDFFKVLGKDFQTVREELFDKYGILLTSKIEPIKFLIIEGN